MKPYKLFVVRKYIRAKNVAEAIRKERKQPPDDVYVDDAWKANNAGELAEAIGFRKKAP